MASAAPKYPGKVAIRHAVEAGRACGIDVGGYDVRPDGTIRVFDIRAVPAAPPADEFEQLEREGKL